MSSRNLIILVVVVAALGAFIFFVERHQPTTAERLERIDRVFTELDEDAVDTIELRTGRGLLRLERIEGEWRFQTVETVETLEK